MTVRLRHWWNGPLDVEGLALDAVSAARDAVAHASAARGAPAEVDTSAELVRAAFETFEHLRLDGRRQEMWAELSGFVAASDGFVRFHGNYPHHAAALRAALGVEGRRELADVCARMPAQEIEDVVTDAGGICRRVRTVDEWRAHPHARATADDPWVETAASGEHAVAPSTGAPLDGIRVLDLTRVLAGPTASQLMACLGADVLRVDPPQRPELLPQFLGTGMGKRSAELDLRTDADRVRSELLPRADVVLIGYRPGALDRFGLDPDALAADRPDLVVASLSAWGEHGPWGDRSGFDSIVQAACGIADVSSGGDGRPGALPVQALDVATGYRLAAAVIELLGRGRGGRVRASLLGAARALLASPPPRRTDDDGDVSMGVPLVTVSSPHGTLFLPPPPLLVNRRTVERDVGGYGAAHAAWR